MLNDAWVVIPAFREAGAVSAVVRDVRRIVPNVAVVDDGSPDGTGRAAAAAGAIVLRHTINLGQGAALQTGIEYALSRGAAYIFTFDADGQHAPESLETMAQVLKDRRAEVVLGSRFLGSTSGMPLSRRIFLKAALKFSRFHSGLEITDTHNGLRLFTRDAAERVRISQPRMAHASEILNQIRSLGLSYAEAPVSVRYTAYSLRKGQRISGACRILLDMLYARLTC